jgi:hypothetical protein
MYCPNCGNSVPNDLKYCNGCGKRLGLADDKYGSPAKMLNEVLTALFLIVMFGFGILIGLVAVLLGNRVNNDVVVIIACVYLMSIFGICFTLARQVPKLIDARLKKDERPVEYAAPQQLTARTTAQLEEFREPVMSVTEHTTRVLDKIPVKNR